MYSGRTKSPCSIAVEQQVKRESYFPEASAPTQIPDWMVSAWYLVVSCFGTQDAVLSWVDLLWPFLGLHHCHHHYWSPLFPAADPKRLIVSDSRIWAWLVSFPNASALSFTALARMNPSSKTKETPSTPEHQHIICTGERFGRTSLHFSLCTFVFPFVKTHNTLLYTFYP